MSRHGFASVCVSTLLALIVLGDGGVASGQDATRQALALELARTLIDDQMRQASLDGVNGGRSGLLPT
jgi:hypothetical protein